MCVLTLLGASQAGYKTIKKNRSSFSLRSPLITLLECGIRSTKKPVCHKMVKIITKAKNTNGGVESFSLRVMEKLKTRDAI